MPSRLGIRAYCFLRRNKIHNDCDRDRDCDCDCDYANVIKRIKFRVLSKNVSNNRGISAKAYYNHDMAVAVTVEHVRVYHITISMLNTQVGQL